MRFFLRCSIMVLQVSVLFLVLTFNVSEITASIPERRGTPQLQEKAVELPAKTTNNLIVYSKGNTAFKAYMDYRYLTDTASIQYEMQKQATTDEYGFRKYNGLYMIALGTGYAPSCGIKIDITLSSGFVIRAITGDVKSDKHTDATHTFMPGGGSIIEFIVDTRKITPLCLKMGDMSYANMQGSIINIKEVNE